MYPRRTQEANMSAILIITDMAICFVAHGQPLGNFGALIASTTVENNERDMCSLTFRLSLLNFQ